MTNSNSLIVLSAATLLAAIYYFCFRRSTSKSITRANSTSELDTHKLIVFDGVSKILLTISIVSILLSFCAPYLFLSAQLNAIESYQDKAAFIDAIEGSMNPFIAIAGVTITGLAFYIQFKANRLQKVMFDTQLGLQQFESQFYELIRLHRDNVTEMRIEGYDFEETEDKLKKFEKITEGRKVFVTMKTEFECLLSCFSDGKKLTDIKFNNCYELFFSGLEEYKKNHPDDGDMIGLLEAARTKHESADKLIFKKNDERKFLTKEASMHFNYKPFSGHASRLGHYYRHLFLAVKVVVNSKIIPEYEGKMKYLKILRAQLSNFEQMMLFYNWLSGYGEKWEDGTNHFFTEYRMIHNLWYDKLFQNEFIMEHVDELRKTEVSHKDGIFEIDPLLRKETYMAAS